MKYFGNLLVVLVFLPSIIHSQSVGISDTGAPPASGAILDISSSDKGVLLPRTDTATINLSGSVAEGMIIYQNSDHAFYYYTGSRWKSISDGIFERNGQLVYNPTSTDDFILGRTSPLPTGLFNDTLFYFDNSKGALRNGSISTDVWEVDSIGEFSLASGRNTMAYGKLSVAFGENSNARAHSSLVLGKYNVGLGNPAIWLSTDPIFEIGAGKSNAPSNIFTILKNGNTGVKTHLPEKSLDVRGNSQIVHNSSVSNSHLILKENDTEYARLNFENTATDEYFTLAGNPKVDSSAAIMNIYYSDHGNVLTARGNGNVGIGTSNPSDRLHINAVGDLDALRVQVDGLTKLRVFDNGSIAIGANNGNVSSNDVYIHSDLGIGVDVPSERLDVNGNIKSTGIIMPTGAMNGHVLTSDANGVASWQAAASGGGLWQNGGADVYIQPTGNVGIGTSTPGEKLEVSGTIESTGLKMTSNPVNGYVLKSDANGNATWQPDLLGGGGGGSDNDWFVSGNDMWSQPSGNVGIGSTNPISKLSVNSDGVSEAGIASFTNINNGKAVYGVADTVLGNEVNYGGYFVASGRTGVGVYGENTTSEPAFNLGERYGGLFKATGSRGSGVRGEADHPSGSGVSGFNSSSGPGVSGGSDVGFGVNGYSDTGTAGRFYTLNGTGLFVQSDGNNKNTIRAAATGSSATGIRVTSSGSGYGIVSEISGSSLASIWAINNAGPSSFAGLFNGAVSVMGSLSKSSGTFKIDHPSDPENKYLYHSFVESPDMMNIYNGNITTDNQGFAWVELPDYFEDLNQEFRYQLTVIGTFAQAIIKEKIENGHFLIQSNEANIEVSWQVTGVRKDPYAQANRVIPVVEKEEEDKGKYLHPEVYGKDKTEGIFYYNSETGRKGN